jgi:hypothetical protein
MDRLIEIGTYALVTNGGVLLAFIIAYFVEVRPLAREKEDPLAGACLDRASVNFRRFVWLYLGLQVALSALYLAFSERLRFDDSYIIVVFFPSFLIAYSSFLFYRKDYYSRLKQVVTQTGAPVLVDLNRQILDKIFVWPLEVLSAIGIVVCGVLYFEGDFSIAFMSAVLLMFYASIRTRKYMVKEGFSYWYKALLFFNISIQPLKLLEIASEYHKAGNLPSASTAVIAVTAALIALQLVLCLARLPAVWRGIRSARLNGSAAGLT